MFKLKNLMFCFWFCCLCFCSYYSFVVSFSGLELIILDFNFDFLSSCFFISSNVLECLVHVPYSLAGVLYFILGYKLSDLSLYIYSYHIYSGNKNWYKFFRDRELVQKKQNSNDWKIYLESLKRQVFMKSEFFEYFVLFIFFITVLLMAFYLQEV